MPAGHVGQRAGIRLQAVRRGLPGHGAQAHPDQALHPQDQRQGRTVHSDALPGMGLHHGVRELGGAKPLASTLPVDL